MTKNFAQGIIIYMEDISNQNITTAEQNTFNEEEIHTSLSTSALLAKSAVPYSHRRAADNYVIIKRIYKFQAIRGRINHAELNLLKQYDMQTLENTTIKQMNEDISNLKKWSLSNNKILAREADEIIQIRAKELKNIVASKYATISNEMYNGYRALERYFDEITKFYA
jgi:hypothetical protein